MIGALLAVSAVLVGCADGAGDRQTVRVAAASDLRFAFEDIAALIQQDHPEVDIRVTYGSSGQFVQQIRNGAPFDIFLSADRAYVEDLVTDNLTDESTMFDYAVGRLVTWYPTREPATPGVRGLADASIRTVAIANPEHAPYGRAALEALTAAGVLADVQPKVVLGENVSQAAEFARTGNADAAIVALSLVLADPLRDVGSWTEVDPESFTRLDQTGVILATAESPEGAQRVREAMTSEAGRTILAEYGFTLPEAP